MTTPAYNERGSSNVFTRKVGPLPVWSWAGIALLAVLFIGMRKKASANNTSSPSTVDTPGGVDASLVPQFVNQTFVNETPPAAPSHVNVTLSGNPDQPVVTQQEGTSGTKVGGLSVTPHKNKTDVGFGLIPGNHNGYVVQLIDLANNKYLYNKVSSTNHPVLPALKPGKYKLIVTGKGYSGSVDKTFTVGSNLTNA